MARSLRLRRNVMAIWIKAYIAALCFGALFALALWMGGATAIRPEGYIMLPVAIGAAGFLLWYGLGERK